MRNRISLHERLFDSLEDAIALINQEGAILDVNFAWTNIMVEKGVFSETAFVGNNYLEVLNVAAASGDHLAGDIAQGILEVISGKHACFNLQYPFHNSGSKRWFMMRVTGLKDCSSRMFVISLRSLRQRKLTEETQPIAAMAFEMNDGVIVTDVNKIILFVNQPFCRLTGYCAEELIGQNKSSFPFGRHSEAFWALVEYDDYWHGEILTRRKNGEELSLWLTISAIKNTDGFNTHYVCLFSGITIQKQAKTVLLDPSQRLENQAATPNPELEKTKKDVEDVKIALNVMTAHRELDKSYAQIEFSREVEVSVLPLLRKLKEASFRRHQSIRMIGIVEGSLQHLMQTQGGTSNLSAAFQYLTAVERLVASLVRQGLPTKVIAATLDISVETVNIHRKHIRKKLGLDNRSTNLYCYLMSLAG